MRKKQTVQKEIKELKLNETELRELDRSLNSINNLILEIKLSKLEVEKRLLSVEVLRMKALQQEQLVESKKRDHAEVLKTLAKKYNLNAGWGYNPDTGEIKTT